MSWTCVMSIWENLLDHLCDDFPFLEKAALVRFRGDQSKLISYLAETHDLTECEAEEALHDWIDFTATRIRNDIAA